MKKLLAVVAVFFVFVLAANHGFAREYHANPQTGHGRVVIRFSPTLGFDVGAPIIVDGVLVQPLTKGHVFDRYLTAGPHIITVSRNGLLRETTHTSVHVRPGHTYSFVLKRRVNEVILVPVGHHY